MSRPSRKFTPQSSCRVPYQSEQNKDNHEVIGVPGTQCLLQALSTDNKNVIHTGVEPVTLALTAY